MSSAISFFKCLSGRTFRNSSRLLNFTSSSSKRNFADTPKSDTTTKHVVVQGTENEQRLRVRRVRASDVPRVLRFVRENARVAWPSIAARTSAPHLVLCDYVSRALAQGHSMLAEQQEPRGWSVIRGLALGTAVCQWDPVLLERWAHCVECPHCRRFIDFTAHCLRAPALHEKYHVHKILQVVLVVPQENQINTEIINKLADTTIERGKIAGFPLIRFDISDNNVAQSLEKLQMKREWELPYEVFTELIKEKRVRLTSIPATDKNHTAAQADNILEKKRDEGMKTEIVPTQFITVYTVQADKS